MKQKIANFSFILLSFLSLSFIFYHNKEVAIIIINATNIFFKRVFVSLFPMFILNDIFISLNLPYYFTKIFTPLFKKLMNTSGYSSYVFFMSIISGTPTNAYIIKELVINNEITCEEANHYLYFTYFSNPLFLITCLSLIFPLNTTLKIIFIHYFTNLIIGILLKQKAPSSSVNYKFIPKKFNLSTSIKKSMNTMLLILGTIVFFMLFTYIITNLFNLPFLLNTIISGILEITNGLNKLISLNVHTKIKEIIAILTISFGGLSIHSQVASIIEDTNINYKYFLKGRIYQALISGLIVLFI